jgi:hypothetical protein
MGAEIARSNVLPRTKKLLDSDLIAREQDIRNTTTQGASAFGDGDGWHSTTYRELERQKVVGIYYLLALKEKAGVIEILQKPSQNDQVEIGHMVKAKLFNDPVVVEAGVPYSIIHILPELDVKYLHNEFDGIEKIIVSNESPIGKALIGLKRGEKTEYLSNQILQIMDDDDAIRASSLFDE